MATLFRGDGRPQDPFGDPLDAILAEIAINLQLSPGLHAKAVERYNSVCRYIDRQEEHHRSGRLSVLLDGASRL